MDASEAPGALAKMIEECEVLRRRVLEKPEQVLTRWVNERAVGVPSVAAMRLNHSALEVVARWWVERCEFPKTAQIDRMREEATHTGYRV